MENEQGNTVKPGAKTYPDGDRMILGFEDGSLSEYSSKLGEILHDYDRVFDDVFSMAKSLDNKSIFVCSYNMEFKEFDILSHNEVNNFKVWPASYCVVT